MPKYKLASSAILRRSKAKSGPPIITAPFPSLPSWCHLSLSKAFSLRKMVPNVVGSYLVHWSFASRESSYVAGLWWAVFSCWSMGSGLWFGVLRSQMKSFVADRHFYRRQEQPKITGKSSLYSESCTRLFGWWYPHTRNFRHGS